MEYVKSKIQIAGAGAGKTHDLSELVLNQEIQENKNIYVITYTNFARKNIENSIKKQKGYIPDNIKISTIHTFLLNEVIYPYSNYILKRKYTKAVSIPLPNEIERKQFLISQLQSKEIIHNEKVFNIAKQILVGNKSQTKKQVAKRKNILEHFIASVEAIYIDEAQDLDEDVIKIIEKLASKNIKIYMVGDTKQAIRYPHVLENFIKKVEKGEVINFQMLPYKNITHRLPNEIVQISNLYCPKNQRQVSKSSEKGNISYIDVQDKEFNNIFNKVKENEGLIYIKEKNELFETRSKEEYNVTSFKRKIN